MKKYLLAHDLGTSGNKATLFNIEGKLVAAKTHPYDTRYFNNNWAEQNPDTWWETTQRTICKVIKESRIAPERISGIGFSGQMHGTVFLDKNHRIIRPAIIWADQRKHIQKTKILERRNLT